jgi:flagellin-like protein
MMHKKTKKGVEPVIATVLLLLIVIVAAGVIFGIVLPLIQTKLVGGNLSSCFTVRLTVDTKEGFTCYDQANNKVNVMVSRGADETDVSGVQIIVASDGGLTQSFEINQTIPNKNEKQTYSVDLTIAGNAKEVGVAPIVRIGTIKQLCAISSTAKLEPCTT